MMRALLIAAWIALLGVNTTTARDVTDAEKAALQEQVANYVRIFDERDFDGIANSMPPAFFDHMSAQLGISPAAFRGFLIEQIRKAMDAAEIESHEMDFARTRFEEGTDGTPFALVPTTVIINAGDKGRYRVERDTVGILEDGKWWLMRVGENQVAIVTQIYPYFEGFTFRGSTTTVLD